MMARISWNGPSSDDYNLLYKSPTSITITFGGINTNKYSLNTLPIGFYEKYNILYDLVMQQIMRTPLIGISIGNTPNLI